MIKIILGIIIGFWLVLGIEYLIELVYEKTEENEKNEQNYDKNDKI